MLHSFSWDQYFITLTYLVSMKSKDPSTRVGAVIVDADNRIRATGYNGLPHGIADRKYRYEDRVYKLQAANHAEENAILYCARNGVAIKGCKIYCQWTPCAQCTKSIIQVGITEVIYHTRFPGNSTDKMADWAGSMEISKEMLSEAGILFRGFDGNLIEIQGLYKGETINLPTDKQPLT